MSRNTRLAFAALLAASLAFMPIALPALGVGQTSPASADEITWSVEPAPAADGPRGTFEYSVGPGTQISDSIVVTNRGETTAEFLIYATDAINELETGSFGLLKRDETPTDVGSWITTSESTLTLAPGTQGTIPFDLVIPSDATPGDHVAGIVAAVLTEGTENGSAITLEQRVGARVYLQVSGLRSASVEVSGLTSGFGAALNPFAPGDVNVTYTVTNTGNVRLDVNQSLAVTGPFGIPLAEVTPKALSDLLPRQSVRVTTNVPAIVAAILAISSVTLVPGAIGSAGDTATTETDSTPAPSDPPESSENPSSTEPTATTETPAPAAADAAGAETVAATDDEALDFIPVTSSVTTLAISWTLLAIILLVVAIIVFVARYVSGTRERMYLAIDEATEAARQEALTSKETVDK